MIKNILGVILNMKMIKCIDYINKVKNGIVVMIIKPNKNGYIKIKINKKCIIT
jgi:hypothetical protein